MQVAAATVSTAVPSLSLRSAFWSAVTAAAAAAGAAGARAATAAAAAAATGAAALSCTVSFSILVD